jgi:hypothetical protein
MRRAENFSSDFLPEWLGIAALCLLDVIFAQLIGLHVILTWRDGLEIAAGLGVMFVLKLFSVRRGSLMAEYFILTAAATAAFVVLSYLCLAASGPLIDGSLLAADRAMGFDWLSGLRFLQANRAPREILRFAYDSMVYQGLYFCVLLSLLDRKQTLREMFWLVFVTGLLTSLGVALFPAMGPFQTFHAAPPGSFLPEMEHLKSGHNLTFALAKMTGVVSFPSFHTTMALANIWGFRRTGIIGWIIAGLNLVMLFAIPWFGGHYLVDMIAGAAVMAVSWAIVHWAPAIRAARAAPALRGVPA